MVKHHLTKSSSLIELLVAMAIFTMISYLVLSSTITSRATSTVAGASIFLNSQAQLAASTIMQELMTAKTSDVYFNDASCGGSACIGFSIPVVETDGSLVLVGGNPVFGDGQTQGNYIRYILNETNLQRQTLAADKTNVLGTRTLAQNLGALTITYNSATSTYVLSLTFSLASYENMPLSPPLTLNSSIAVAPKN